MLRKSFFVLNREPIQWIYSAFYFRVRGFYESLIVLSVYMKSSATKIRIGSLSKHFGICINW